MTRLVPLTLLIGLSFAVDKEGKEKTKFDVTGIVIGENGEGLKKVKLTIFNDLGEKVESGKTKKGGEFKFKKMKAGAYRIVGEHKKEGEVSVDFSITRRDVDLKIEFQSELIDESPIVDDLNEVAVPLVTLPQQKEQKSNQQLKFDELFFEYESNLKALEIEVDSLKSVVKGYEKGQSMPNISREILDLIKIPETQNRIELQNGTVVSGEILQESDSTLTLNTRIGKLVLKKEMVVRMDELQKPGPKVVFLGDPFIDYYPDKQVFSGRVQNIGQVRADFVRVIGNLFDQTTQNTGMDSVFVKGSRVVYESNVVADTALEPGQTASYVLTVSIKKGQKTEYHTMDVHWNETK
tara:strand:- start:109 stop:1161 length:1053 start_codon:yes stop_codon:yes gene_type:complete